MRIKIIQCGQRGTRGGRPRLGSGSQFHDATVRESLHRQWQPLWAALDVVAIRSAAAYPHPILTI